MTKSATQSLSNRLMNLLSRLLLRNDDKGSLSSVEALSFDIQNLSRAEFDEMLGLANSNHVVVRAMDVLLHLAREAHDDTHAEWAFTAQATERVRITTALTFLTQICDSFRENGHDVTVIKSLDHWPDLGSDLDLYTDTKYQDVITLMKTRFHAQLAPRSWGDRLARKWNFLIPGLPEAVEIHMGRLGQTGEQLVIASNIAKRSRRILIGERAFRVPSASDRLMISTLQRMYRHFYFRLCDIIDSAELADTGAIDYVDLQSSATEAGIWEGVATYLVIVSDYAQHYRGTGLDLPQFVRTSARFGGEEIYYNKEFLRVPIMPQSAKLYGTQLAGMLRRRELHSSARLGLLPWLATAALVGQKLTGSDKGIW